MVKAANNNRFTKDERLNSKKRIDSLFQNGKLKWKGCLRITYLISNEVLETPVQVMFSVPKKQFRRAVDRNLVKRRMREAYRLNKHNLSEQIRSKNKFIMIAFLYVSKEIERYLIIESDMKELLVKISKSI